MGINGLLQALKPIAKQVHVRQYQGQRVAVDGYSWLHKGAYCCARELCEGLWTDKFVTYFMSRIQLLRTNGVEPIVVFDGGRLPIKGEEESSRHRARAEARNKAAAYLAAGNAAMAHECYQRCVDITPAMAKQVIEELKAQGVAFLVAPYEADAQMAYLARSGAVQVVVTEDSDLLAYGCPKVLYKLDKTGTGEEVSLTDLPNCPSLPMSGWTADQFLQLCVMAGCDFLAQMPGIGIKKAHGVLRKYRTFTKVVKMMRFNGTKVPPDYETRFQLALWAFRHARVYCTTEKAMIHLVPLPGGGIASADVEVPAAVVQLEQQQQDQKLDFLGPMLPPEVARGIAEGELDPNTHQPYNIAAIYAGCSRPPAHLAAQLAAQQPSADPADADQPCSSSQPAATPGKPRVGLSRRHAGHSGGAARRMSGAGVAGASGGARSGGAGGLSGGLKKRASLGIAKYFQKPATAAAGAGGGHAVAPVTTGVHRAASALAGAAAQAAAAPVAPSIRQSVADAISALEQRLQHRKQQQAEEQQVQRQPLQDDEAVEHGLHDEAFALPPAKRHRSCGDVTAAGASAAAANAAATAASADDSEGAGAAAYVLQQGLPQSGFSMESSQPAGSGSLGLPGMSQSPAVGGSMSLGLGSSGVPAGSSAGPESMPSLQEPGAGLSSDPSLLYGSLDGACSQQPRSRGAAVSALTALFGPAGGSFGRGVAGIPGDAAVAAGAWDAQFSGGSGGGSGGVPGGYFSEAELGGSGLLSSGSDLGASMDGCGSSSGLSLGSLGGGSSGGGPAVLDGAASVSFGMEGGQGCGPATPSDAGAGSNAFKHLQQSLRAALRKPSQPQQQQPAPPAAGRSSFFSQQQQQQQEPAHAARRHSRFREQWLQDDSDEGLMNSQGLLSKGLPTGVSSLQDSPDDPFAAQTDGQQRALTAAQREPAGDGDALFEKLQRPATQQQQRPKTGLQRPQTGLHLSDSSGPSSSGTTSNDENADGADALEQLGMAHVKQYARLAHKVVKSVAKQQQGQQQYQHQQQAPLSPKMSLLNTQLQSQPGAMQQRRQHTAAGHDGGRAAATAGPASNQRARQKIESSTGGLHGRGKAGKAAGASTGSFAEKLSQLRYDPSMFVNLDDHQQQRQQREQEEQQDLGLEAADDALPGPVARQAGMFGRGAGAAAAARKPFKAPWLAAAAAADSPSLSDVLGAGGGEAGAEFGAFADFAMAGIGAGGPVAGKRANGLRRRGAQFKLR